MKRKEKLMCMCVMLVVATAFGGIPRWISGNTKAPESSAPIVYRDFRLDSMPERAEMTLAVAGWHELSVNGRRVGDEVLSPVTCQPNLRHSSVTRDITKFLRVGENRIEVLLGNGWFNCFTKDVWGFSAAPWQDAPMILGSLRIDGRQLLVTDGKWRACDSPIVFTALRNGEWYDARKEGLRENDRPATVVKYPPYAAVSPEDAAPCRAFDPIPPIRSFPAGDGGTIYDFGSNRAGWCEIEVSGEAGARVVIDYDEALTPSNTLRGKVVMFQRRAGEPRPCQHDEYTLAGRADGERWHPRFTYHGFRYAQVRMTGTVELKSIRSVFVHSDFAEKGSFSISDPVFAKLLDATRRSYFSNFVGIPTDCPHREKNGWTGDTQLAMETGLWNFDGTAGYLHFLRMMLDAQRRNGAVPCIIPCTEKFGFLWGSGPAWDAVLFEIPWQVFRFTGNDAPAREAFAAMKKYLGFIAEKADDDGLVDYGLGDWCPPKDLKAAPVRLTDSAYVYEFNRRTAIWAERFGEQGTAKACRARAAAIREAFNRTFYKGNGIYADGQPTALAAALYFPRLCAEGESDKVAKELVRRIREGKHKASFGILGAKWVPRVLSDHGYIEDAWRMFVQPEYPGWARWMTKYDTLWENWEDSTTSFNHIMYGDLSAWAFEYLAGIKITGPGFEKVDVKPYLPEGVDFFSAEYESPKGKIKVLARRLNGQPAYETVLPPELKADDNICPRPSRASAPPLEVKRLSVDVGASRPFSVLHVSDSHLAWIDGRDDEAVFAFARARKGLGRELGGHYLDEALEYADQRKLRVVHTGDIVEFASVANAESVTRLCRDRSLIACVGNHEFWKDRKVHDERDKQQSASWVRSAFSGEQPTSVRELNGVVFFAFDNSFGRVSDEVVESFGRAVSRGRPMVLVCHVPFPTPELLADAAVSSSLMGEGHAAGDARTQEFIARVRAEPLVKAILCGHLHVARRVRFSPSAMEYVAGALFNGVAQEVAFR